MSKQAIIFSIDAGFSMDERFIDSQSSRLKIALECLKLTLQQKLFNNSSHEIGFSLFGQNQTDDGNSTLLFPIGKPDLDFVRKVVQLSDITLQNDKVGGDIFAAIDFTIEQLIGHCGSKKYNKRAFLFTNGRGKTKHRIQDLKRIARKISDNDIKLNIIPMDFMQTYDFSSNQLDNQIFANPQQQNNSEMLILLRGQCAQNIQIYPASLAIELYKKFRKRDTNPVALFKGKFQIAPNMTIDVCSYKAIRKQKLKSLSKFDLTTAFDPNLNKQKQIQIDVNYIIEGDAQGTIIDKSKVMNAYQFGNNLVPMDQMIQNASKIFQEKNFTLLGFVQSQKVPRHCFLGEMDIVVPQKEDPIGRKLFSAFIYSMLLQKKYAVARYIPRNNKKGVTPKLVVLIPFRSPDRQMFYLTQLPTTQGVRDYPFNSLKKSTQQQKSLVKQLVDKMMLVRTQDDKEKQEAKIQNMFNPFRQYFYQTIFYRALNDDQKDQVPELDQTTRNYITPQLKIYQKTGQSLNKIKKEFRFKVNELNRDKQKQKKVIIWKDVLSMNNSQITMQQSQAWQSVGQQVGKKFTLSTQEDDHFIPSAPIISFKKMMSNTKKDMVSQGLNQLSNYIYQQNKYAITQQKVDHLVECAKEMRVACIQQKEVEFWDLWFEKAVGGLSARVYHTMKRNGLAFINRNNQAIFKIDIVKFNPVTIEVDQLD